MSRYISNTRVGGQPQFTRVLGPVAFGGTRTALLVLVVLCVTIRVLVEVQAIGTAHERLYMTRAMVLIGVLFMQAMMTFGEASRCRKRTAEQALVRLAPAAPAAGAINRSLAAYLLARFAGMWAQCAVVTVAMLWVLGATAGEALRAAAVCGLALVLAGTLLRDYAREAVANRLQPLTWAAGASVVLLAASAGSRGKLSGAAWTWLAMAGIVAITLFIWRRWRCMVQAPPAFPAGRNR
ncbi:MAG: hypothetical protein JWQ01_1570 [Massilia sp.]|nr:hypothetical protein [Massilia sp.]